MVGGLGRSEHAVTTLSATSVAHACFLTIVHLLVVKGTRIDKMPGHMGNDGSRWAAFGQVRQIPRGTFLLSAWSTTSMKSNRRTLCCVAFAAFRSDCIRVMALAMI